MRNLGKFYNTEEGKKYNPDMYEENSPQRKTLEEMRKVLFSIAIMESGLNSKSVNNQVPGNEAFGYF
jgi:hypothetical protein